MPISGTQLTRGKLGRRETEIHLTSTCRAGDWPGHAAHEPRLTDPMIGKPPRSVHPDESRPGG